MLHTMSLCMHVLGLKFNLIGFRVFARDLFVYLVSHCCVPRDKWIGRDDPWENNTIVIFHTLYIFTLQIHEIPIQHISFFLFQSIKDVDLQALASLEYLDLSRNLIREIMPGTFLGMVNLKGLDFSVNVVRKVR